jgi:hypothetical protein
VIISVRDVIILKEGGLDISIYVNNFWALENTFCATARLVGREIQKINPATALEIHDLEGRYADCVILKLVAESISPVTTIACIWLWLALALEHAELQGGISKTLLA